MVKPDLQVEAARLVLGDLSPEAKLRIADELVDAGEFTPAAGELEYLRLESHPSSDDVDTYFRRLLTELGVPLPSKDEAVWALARHYVGAIASGNLPPYQGLELLAREVYYAAELYEQTRHYVGDSHGLQDLLGMYYAYDDLREYRFPGANWFARRRVAAAEAKMDQDTVRLAREWLAAHGLTSGSS